MCLETVETKVSTDPNGSQSSHWLPVVKSFLYRFTDPVTSMKETEGSEESLPTKLKKFVGEASEKFATASGSLFADLASTTSSTTKKAIDGIKGTELPVVAWNFPDFPLKPEIGSSWLSIRLFWEKTLFGNHATDGADTLHSETDASDNAGREIETVNENKNIDVGSGEAPVQRNADTAEAKIAKPDDDVQPNHELVSDCAEVGLGVEEQTLSSEQNSPTQSLPQCDNAITTAADCESTQADFALLSSATGSGVQEDQAPSTLDDKLESSGAGSPAQTEEGDGTLQGQEEGEETLPVPSSATPEVAP